MNVLRKKIDEFKFLLNNKLPGYASRLGMYPPDRKAMEQRLPQDLTLKRAAVLIHLFDCQEDSCFVLTRRKQGLKDHSGQISFPGGRVEEGDMDVIDTAIRENWEETGFRIQREQVLGTLTPLTIPHTRFYVVPVVSYGEKKPRFKKNDAEVAEIFIVPMEELLSGRSRKTKYMNLGGQTLKVPYFDLQHQVVWGATAIILEELRMVIEGLMGE